MYSGANQTKSERQGVKLRKNHIAILQQVDIGVSQTELEQILNQLRSLIRSAVPPAPPSPVNQPHPSGSNIKTESLPATLPPSIPALQDINKLLLLIKAGVVSSSSTLNNSTPPSASASHEKRSPTPETFDLSREAKHQYRTAILAQKVKLTSSDILRTRPQVVELRTCPQVVRLFVEG
ncbi:hypothetical protein K443DRAFT_14437 [Laccaria amethystina LaAM-08-1]|uniref:Uncharacterized protein n=1 Tax=Laccaria amethystina LaAM-08-1 TaxID=1095629 RepID=A0A0C9WHL2_9AGAR|nr:hypothetical protein K443DRAFT_14437 [Laccaria amethystina LaAM-08-1]